MPAPRTKHFLSLLFIVRFLMCGFDLATAATVRFENDQAGWEAAASANGQRHTIDFDSIASDTLLLGDEFSSLPGTPTFSSIFAFDGTGPYVAFHDSALSGSNVLRPTNSGSLNDGVVRVTFDTPIYAMAASFFDVEGDRQATGFGLGSQTITPDIAFSTQRSDAYQFLAS